MRSAVMHRERPLPPARLDADDEAHVGLALAPCKVDAIWRGLREAATELALRETVLRQRLRKLVLDRCSLADAIGAVLADRLASADLGESSLRAIARQLFADDEALLTDVVKDLQALQARDPACVSHLHGLLAMKGFHALQTHRVAHALWTQGRKELALVLSDRCSIVFCVDIHPAARLGASVMLDHGSGVVIGETAVVDGDVSILQNVTLGGTGKERGDRHPKVRRGVLIGAGAKILGNIEIGAMSKVAAGSVVLEAVPPHCTVAGVPARIVRWHEPARQPALDMDQSVRA